MELLLHKRSKQWEMFQNSCTIQLGISGFLFSIPPIAAKFQSPEKMGLQSQI
jgi:hypothetical protein